MVGICMALKRVCPNSSEAKDCWNMFKLGMKIIRTPEKARHPVRMVDVEAQPHKLCRHDCGFSYLAAKLKLALCQTFSSVVQGRTMLIHSIQPKKIENIEKQYLPLPSMGPPLSQHSLPFSSLVFFSFCSSWKVSHAPWPFNVDHDWFTTWIAKNQQESAWSLPGVCQESGHLWTDMESQSWI